jgi:hypothetical protein
LADEAKTAQKKITDEPLDDKDADSASRAQKGE